MPKGHKCPVCDRYTLQPYTTNQLRCTNPECRSIIPKERVS